MSSIINRTFLFGKIYDVPVCLKISIINAVLTKLDFLCEKSLRTNSSWPPGAHARPGWRATLKWFYFCKGACITGRRRKMLLKGVCHEIFNNYFFINSICAPDKLFKFFRLRFRCRRDILKFKKLLGVHDTAESYLAMCMTPQSQPLWCAWHRGVKMHTAETGSKTFQVSGCSENFDSAVSCTLWHCVVRIF